jgi:hypothetical protein
MIMKDLFDHGRLRAGAASQPAHRPHAPHAPLKSTSPAGWRRTVSHRVGCGLALRRGRGAAPATVHDVNPARQSKRTAPPEISGNIGRGTKNTR